MSEDLQDTIAGLVAAVIIGATYALHPIAGIGVIAFSVGVTSMRAHRARNRLEK